ncbi:unnamed protein product [Cylindrotheca closterium]|uniref:THIF-type NAD/FAD binding fold domain-containing protein n=1 Tax=Cylindrotheca closterium TaxID=2856 RepID=A0AAD2G071_9STRA|nr:unnamed protein product [Cylindrotheca closterium]
MIPRLPLLLSLFFLQHSIILAFSFVETGWSRSSTFRHESLLLLRQSGDDASDEQVSSPIEDEDEAREQRNLRFAGVGRLYAEPNNQDDIDTSIAPHLQVVDRLTQATVVVVGLGGVGSWAAEALCRSGIGNLVLIDLDDICISNTNRQMHAMASTIGNFKIDEMARRFRDINPNCNITLIHDFVSPDNVDEILTSIPNLTACLDAMDGAKGKCAMIAACCRYQIPIVTCGGSAGRTDPCAFVCEDLTRVNNDPLLSNCRKNLRKFHGFEAGVPANLLKKKLVKPPKKWNIQAVISTEPQKTLPKGEGSSSLRRCDGALGTGVFVTGTSGFGKLGHF